MAKTFRIDIREPIWNGRKVGINLSQCNPEDIVEVHIHYENKTSKRRVFPFTYLMLASDIAKYPAKPIKNGIILYHVPINDFKIKEENNLNFEQNARNMNNPNQ